MTTLNHAMRRFLFAVLRVYVLCEQSSPVRWLRGAEPDVILEPLPRLEAGVPQVYDARSVFISGDQRAAYVRNGGTLRRVAQNDGGALVYLRKASKPEQREMKRYKGPRVNAIRA